uniref:Uncharacterized protein n=1 Tax=Arundo donax TaxID=35708 RepID=A0A0A8YRB4_ARUDO
MRFLVFMCTRHYYSFSTVALNSIACCSSAVQILHHPSCLNLRAIYMRPQNQPASVR